MEPPHIISFDALGTRFHLEIFDTVTPAHIKEITVFTEQFLTRFEKRYSRFLSDSVVSTINRERVLYNPETEFVQLLEQGRALFVQTQGLFNMLLGSTLENRGYDSTYSLTPTTSPSKEIKHPNPLTDLSISPTSITLHSGKLDLGGFGKGYLIDVLARHLQETHGLHYFLINGGGDIFATSNHGSPFTIYLEHPLDAGTFIGTTTILNQGFAASSPHKRSWVHNGNTYNHIIDTTPQLKMTQLCDASFIIARTCVEADAFATIALMLAPEALTNLAVTQHLAYATFTAPSTLTANNAFVVQNL